MKNRFKVMILGITIAAILTAVPLAAQESNSGKSTYGRIGNDVDNYLSVWDFTKVDFSNIFAFTRFGNAPANDGSSGTSTAGKLEVGFATHLGQNNYLGLYYGGTMTGQPFRTPASSGSFSIMNGTDSTDIAFDNPSKAYFPTQIGAIVGLGSLGLKLFWDDTLSITSTGTTGTPGTSTYKGSLKPTFQVGGLKLGPIDAIGLTVDIVYDSTSSVTNNTSNAGYSGNSAGGTTNYLTLLTADGSYVEPDIYLSFWFGGFGLENDLALRIYGTPSFDKGGKASNVPGLGWYSTTYDPYTDANSSTTAVWNSKFYLFDTIVPYYTFAGNTETEKVKWDVKIKAPMTFTFGADSLNALSDTSAKKVEVKDFYKASSFAYEVTPTVEAGIQFKPAPVFSVQAGIQAKLFTWEAETNSTTKVDTPTDTDQQSLLTNNNLTTSGKSTKGTSTFTMPAIGLSAGFTVNIGKTAALDFRFLSEFDPTLLETVYKAFGDGFGAEASIVLALKF